MILPFSSYWITNAVLRIWDVYPWSWFLPFPDPGSKNRNKREGWKNWLLYLFYSHKFHKIEFFFWNAYEKNLASFHRITELINKKFVTKLSKIRVWDPRSGIWDPEKPISNRGSGSRGQKGSRSRIRNTARVILFLGKRKGSNRKWGGGKEEGKMTTYLPVSWHEITSV